MPGLAVKINSETTFNSEFALNSIKKIYKVPGLHYKEADIINGNFLFYNCFPDFIQENKLERINDNIIMYEGDYYNFDELCKQLSRQPLNKTELIYLLFRKYGDNFAQYLNGEFNILIYNVFSKRLLVTNDRFARRSFFYSFNQAEFICGSEKKAILSFSTKFEIDHQGLLQVFALAHNIEGRTFLKNIFSLTPASVLIYENKCIKISHYYTWYYEAHNSQNKTARIEELHTLLANAVKVRLTNKKRVSLMLSGGMDSRAIACAIEPEYRKNVIANTFGENGSLELEITSMLSKRLNYRHFQSSITKNASVIAELGAWRNEFAISAFRHPFSAFHEELKSDSDYLTSGLPGLDYLDGSWITPRIILYSLFPKYYEQLLYRYCLTSLTPVLEKIFKKKYYYEEFSALKKIFVQSVKNINAANNCDRYDIWNSIQRGPQFSYMADMVERDLFEIITPFTDINVLRFLSGIPTKKRMMQQHSVALFLFYYPEVRDIEFDAGRGVVTGKNRILSKFVDIILKGFKHYKVSLVWDIAEAIRNDTRVGQIIIEIISSSDELKDKIFDIENIKKVLSEHNKRTVDYSSIIDCLLTFVLAYKYFCINDPIQIPQTVTNYYSEIFSSASCI